MKTTLTFIAIVVTSLTIYAQKSPIKYGKVSKEELEMKSCAFDSEAASMILGRTGTLYFRLHSDKGWQYQLEVIVRKKIFNLLDKDEANVKLSLYDPVNGNSREEISKIQAVTYNIIDGKIEKTKLTNSEEYTTRISDYRIEKSFAMPNVREGSVIEYRYILLSDYIDNLTTWYFQDDIPTAYSEFTFTIPEFFIYQESQVGHYISLEIESNRYEENFTYTYSAAPSSGQNSFSQEKSNISSQSTKKTLVARNIPAVQEEPMMNNRVDLPSRMEFQLKGIQYPSQPYKNMTSDYDALSKRIMDWESFGGTLKKGGFSKDFIASINTISEKEKPEQIYNWLSQHFSWNGNNAVTSGNAGRAAFKEAVGHVADINLTLLSALKQAELEAYPVILSTRGHGILHPVYPNLQDFNYVICAVIIGDNIHLLDASSKLPFGTLPEKCLNGYGWLVKEETGEWVNLKSGSHLVTTESNISIRDNVLISDQKIVEDGYAALATNQKYKKIGEEDYVKVLEEKFAAEQIMDFVFEQKSPVSSEINFSLEKEMDNPEVYYIQPIIYGAITQNPFKRETRISPVDLKYNTMSQHLVKIEIPEGYAVEAPESAAIRLPQNAASFVYSVTELGNQVTIMSRMEIKKLDFSPEEYPLLKQFYQLVSDKNNELVVLKKQ